MCFQSITNTSNTMRLFSATIKCRKTPLLVLAILLALNGEKSFIAPVSGRTNVHIVYMGERQHNDPALVTESHHEMLASVLGSKEAATDSMIYSYRHGFSGFAAKLTESQVEQISRLPGVIKVSPNHSYKLKTTRSWDFLGLPITSASSNDLLHKANMGDGVIVGVFDSGLWPESEQYNDEGLGPIPRRWKGKCVSGESFDAKKNCNRKLIGAKWYNAGLIAEFGNVINTTEGYREYMSARDASGHGTHTSTTATGSIVHNVSHNGLAMGTVRGGAPRARVAMYKTCWVVPLPAKECTAADMMKAFDDAIHDGVDLLSISIGYHVPMFAEVDPNELVMYGAFHAVARGISVICVAGNFGPYSETVQNISPWATTVAAVNMDRNFPTKVTLGNSMFILGQSLYTGKEINFTALMHAGDIPTGPTRNSTCENISFNNTPATGKVVLCFSWTMKDIEAAANATLQAGGIGLIVAKNPTSAMTNVASDFPQVFVDYELGTKILFYIRSTSSPKVKISPAKTLVGKPVGTYVARFSSRGPNSIAPAILKPDVAAPGVKILSSIVDGFGFISGTSMATPHVAGIVALLKVLRPGWSPAAVRSALTTTAWKTDPFGEPIFAEDFPRKLADSFDYGGGLVNPDKVADPGLVYDMGVNDYTHYLCAVGYNETSISLLVGQKTKCPKPAPSILDVNVPAITIPNLKKSVTLTRTVTNVGPVHSVYRAEIEPPIGISVSVNPSTLIFNAKTKLLSFKVTVSTFHQVNGGYYFGSLTWTDGMHNVSSPISVRTQILELYAEDY